MNTQTNEKINVKSMMSKAQALANFLDVNVNEIIEESEDLFTYGREEYLVFTDEEADDAAKDYILESLWAFNKSFLDGHSKIIAEIPDKEFQEMQGSLCESFNAAILKMLDDVDYFVEDAIKCDGRGHFLSGYDGEENEEGEYFIYRTN